MPPWKTAIAEQEQANERSWQYRDSFGNHRAALTNLLLGPETGGRLCVLGAGNCADLDLERLTSAYDEVHLVDVDGNALARAVGGLNAASASRVCLHGGVDLSGLQGHIERWATLRVTPEELMEYPERAARVLLHELSGPFDRVVSACLLSQMHLAVRRVLTDSHPLLQAAGFCLNLAHLRTLLALLGPRASALLACDVASDAIAVLETATEHQSPLDLLAELQRTGQVFHAVDPRALSAIAADDPTLERGATLSKPEAAWLWQNGPRRRFLVYALTLHRRVPAPTSTSA